MGLSREADFEHRLVPYEESDGVCPSLPLCEDTAEERLVSDCGLQDQTSSPVLTSSIEVDARRREVVEEEEDAEQDCSGLDPPRLLGRRHPTRQSIQEAGLARMRTVPGALLVGIVSYLVCRQRDRRSSHSL